jgi:prepilin-type N-terminal cleavage/methylation domain-containing protein
MNLRRPNSSENRSAQGFTLLEVLVALTILAVGGALTLSLISGSLGNIRKVQLRTRSVEHAEAMMELALLDDSIHQPATRSGDFEDGARWILHVEDYDPPISPQIQAQLQGRNLQQNMPVKMLRYTLEMFSPDSRAPDFRLQTLKLMNKRANDSSLGVPQ